MNHTTMRILSIVIGVVIGIGVIIGGFKLFQTVFTRAEDIAPRDVVVSDITQNTVKVSWSTGEENQGVIEYGTSPTALNFFAPESQRGRSHAVDLTLLSPATTYYFQIRIADKKYDNGGVPWTFTTKTSEKTQIPSPTVAKSSPTPVATIEVPVEQTAPAACDETDCAKVKAKLGNGCSARDYLLCLKKATPTPTK